MKKIPIVLLFLLLSPVIMLTVQPVSASQVVTANTGEIDLTAGVKVKAIYDASVSVDRPDNVKAGEQQTWDVRINDGTLSISVYIPSPINEWYTISRSVGIGSSTDFPLTSGISARVQLTASTPLNVEGPAVAETSALNWQSEGTQSFILNINENAKGGDVITVQMPLKFQITVGVVVGILMFSYEVSSTNIGTFDATPIITETVSIPATPLDLSLFLVAAVVSLAVIIPVVGFVSYRKGKSKAFPPPPPPF